MRFLYYLFIVKRRLTFLILALAATAGAWAIQENVKRALVQQDAAPVDEVRAAFRRGVETDWDMCAQFHPDMAGQEDLFHSMVAARESVTNGELDKLSDLIEKCARVTVPLTGDRAAVARRKAGLSHI
ncbi:hypothetical protein ACFQUU_13250 [Herbaspirillum sp. GCM10030257]|uniref:hypothetical protein n=1 Tax=Herbaspirillum sp. GCM10030257 TaxID=3273393 RepID=UPI00361D4C69